MKYLLQEEVVFVSSWKTIYKAIQRLVKKNWVGFKSPNFYYPRSFQTVCQLCGCSGKWHVECTVDDIRFIREFAVAAIITSETERHKYMLRSKNLRRRIEESANGGSSQSILRLGSNWMSANMLSKKLEISKSRAHDLKRGAASLGYISIKANRQRVDVSLEEIALFRKYSPSKFWIERKNDRVFVRGPDIITSNMRLKCCRKQGKKSNLRSRDI